MRRRFASRGRGSAAKQCEGSDDASRREGAAPPLTGAASRREGAAPPLSGKSAKDALDAPLYSASSSLDPHPSSLNPPRQSRASSLNPPRQSRAPPLIPHPSAAKPRLIPHTGRKASLKLKLKSPHARMHEDFTGDPVGIRTPNLLIRSQMLYPIELQSQPFSAETGGKDSQLPRTSKPRADFRARNARQVRN